MTTPADLAFSHLLVKNGIAPYETAQRELEILGLVVALGFKVNLARTMKDRGKLDAAGIQKILGIPKTPERQDLLADHLKWLEAEPSIEPPMTDLLIEHGLVARADLDAAMVKLDRAKTLGIKKRPLEALVDLGILLPDAALAVFDVWRRPEEALLEPWDLAFCRLASESGVASTGDLQLAVATQRRIAIKLKLRRPLPEVLYAMGKIARGTLEAAQASLRPNFSEADASRQRSVITSDDEEARVAVVLASTPSVSQTQLQECLGLRDGLEELGLERRTGEVLLMRGYLQPEQLARPGEPEVVGPSEVSAGFAAPPPGDIVQTPADAAASNPSPADAAGEAQDSASRALPPPATDPG